MNKLIQIIVINDCEQASRSVYLQQLKQMSRKIREEDESFHGAPSSRYSRITEHAKQKLCFMVATNAYKVSSAAKSLKINVSTAKMILKKFNSLSAEEQGTILQRGSKSKEEKKQFEQGNRNIWWSKQKIQRRGQEIQREELKKAIQKQEKMENSQENKHDESFSHSWVMFFYLCPSLSFN